MNTAVAISIAICLLGQSPVTLQEFLKSAGKKTLKAPVFEASSTKLTPTVPHGCTTLTAWFGQESEPGQEADGLGELTWHAVAP